MENQINRIRINGMTRTREEWASHADRLQYHEMSALAEQAQDIFWVLGMNNEELVIHGYAAEEFVLDTKVAGE